VIATFTASFVIGFGVTLGVAAALLFGLLAFLAVERWMDP
jgi:hypothetical protein